MLCIQYLIVNHGTLSTATLKMHRIWTAYCSSPLLIFRLADFVKICFTKINFVQNIFRIQYNDWYQYVGNWVVFQINIICSRRKRSPEKFYTRQQHDLMKYRECWLSGQIWTTYFIYIIAHVVPKCRLFITLQDKYNLQL